MVTKPLIKEELAAALHRFSGALTTIKHTADMHRLILKNTDNFERTQPTVASSHCDTKTAKENAEAYAEIEKNMQVTNAGSDSHPGTIAPFAAQLTTSLTLAELKKVNWLYRAMGNPDNDVKMKDFLTAYGMPDILSKPKTFLVKHAAEFVGPTILASVTDDIKYATGTKIPPKMFHAQGNKLAQIMTRNGKTAYMIEFRGQSNDQKGIEHDIYNGFKDNSDKAYFLRKINDNFPEV